MPSEASTSRSGPTEVTPKVGRLTFTASYLHRILREVDAWTRTDGLDLAAAAVGVIRDPAQGMVIVKILDALTAGGR